MSLSGHISRNQFFSNTNQKTYSNRFGGKKVCKEIGGAWHKACSQQNPVIKLRKAQQVKTPIEIQERIDLVVKKIHKTPFN